MINTENLLLLADRLEKLPADYDHFNMSTYAYIANGPCGVEPADLTEQDLHNCGSCACALGHAPLIPGLRPREGEDWDPYALRVFGTDPLKIGGAWDFLFSSSWAGEDDPRHHTAHAAAKRIRYFIEHGVPHHDDWLEYIDA